MISQKNGQIHPNHLDRIDRNANPIRLTKNRKVDRADRIELVHPLDKNKFPHLDRPDRIDKSGRPEKGQRPKKIDRPDRMGSSYPADEEGSLDDLID